MLVVVKAGESSIDMELSVFIETAKEQRIIQNGINSWIKLEFEKVSIEMSYPQKDVKITRKVHYATNFSPEHNP